MKVKNLNHSSEKTKKLIKTTFAELLNEKKELNKITVTELVERADINRCTFYTHYDSIYGVVDDFEEEMMQMLLSKKIQTSSIEDIFKYFDEIIQYLKENEETYRMILSSNIPYIFLKKLNGLLHTKLYDTLNSYPSIHKSKSLNFDISFFTNGMISQFLNYFRNPNFEYSLDDISKYMKKYFKMIFID